MNEKIKNFFGWIAAAVLSVGAAIAYFFGINNINGRRDQRIRRNIEKGKAIEREREDLERDRKSSIDSREKGIRDREKNISEREAIERERENLAERKRKLLDGIKKRS